MANAPKPRRLNQLTAITSITVEGFKSIRESHTVAIPPLTIFAGANSSGKSSFMQPLLLLKQTLEAPFDPGPLLLNGPNVRFSNASEMFFRVGKTQASDFRIGIQASNQTLSTTYTKQSRQALRISETVYTDSDGSRIPLTLDMTKEQIDDLIKQSRKETFTEPFLKMRPVRGIKRERWFLDTHPFSVFDSLSFETLILSIIHLPGLRGNPQRTYPVTAVGDVFPGTFEYYTASVIAEWQAAKESNQKKLTGLQKDLKRLGLTWKVVAQRLADTQVELRVGRLKTPKKGGAKDWVNIADVGFGVSQTLPVIVALWTARPGQLVYIEQPEIHLHPRAQVAMAAVLADAAKRGVRVVIETHSAMLILGVQTLIAQGELDPALVNLCWFERNEEGETTIQSAKFDQNGAFGDFPLDFVDVELEAQSRYLDAVDARHFHV